MSEDQKPSRWFKPDTASRGSKRTDHKRDRKSKPKTWKCDYCGHTFLKKHPEEIHLRLSKDCKKQMMAMLIHVKGLHHNN